jgi:hypothetical protein
MPVQLNAIRGVPRSCFCAGLLAAAALTFSSRAGAATAHDLYVGCHRFVENVPDPPSLLSHPAGDSRAWCGIVAAVAQDRGSANPFPGDTLPRFCLPQHLWWQKYTRKAIVYSYLAYYDKAGGKLADKPGPETFAAAMVDKWPCKDNSRAAQ